MARPTHEEQIEIAHRRQKVSRMLAARVPRSIIAETLGIELETIYNDVKHIKRLYRKMGMVNVALLVAEQALQYNEIVRQELEEYAKDKNPRRHEVALKAMAHFGDLYGLKQPIKIAPTSPDGTQPYNPLMPSDNISNEDLLLAIRSMLEELEESATIDGEALELEGGELEAVSAEQ